VGIGPPEGIDRGTGRGRLPRLAGRDDLEPRSQLDGEVHRPRRDAVLAKPDKTQVSAHFTPRSGRMDPGPSPRPARPPHLGRETPNDTHRTQPVPLHGRL
jgi:hypothetical protein